MSATIVTVNTYIVWNNKGGVGKSTIAFNLAARYAELNPKKSVLVLDLCPQANVTMTLLGGGISGEQHLLDLQASTQTVVGYIDERIAANSGRSGPPRDYHIQVSNFNKNLPENLWLVAGDGNLELIGPAISYYANAQIPTDAWNLVHQWIKDLVGRTTANGKEWVVFIDTNPSFSVYTELAIVAGTHLIVPFKADDSSRVATKALFALLYGSNPPHPVYGRYTFASKAREFGVTIPLCHVFIGNQFTQYRGSAMAFKSMSEAVFGELYSQYKSAPNRYTPRGEIANQDKFKASFVYELRDFNSAGVVAAHQGKLLNQLKEATHDVHGQPVTLDRGRIQECIKSVEEVVHLL